MQLDVTWDNCVCQFQDSLIHLINIYRVPTVCLKSATGKADILVHETDKQWDKSEISKSYRVRA